MPRRRTSALPKATGRDIGTGKVMTLVKSQPPQLSLFQTFFPEQDSDHYSNTIELYDAIPKYFSSKKRVAELRKDGVFLKSLSRRFRHKDQWYDLIVKPARIVDRHGNEKEYYPTHQEELVEEALKKIACDRLNGVFLNDTAGVQFTLYELDKELRSQEHAMKWPDLITSLEIGRSARIMVTSLNGQVEVESAIFPVAALANREEWRNNPRHVRCCVQFNPLVTHSISKLTYRQFDYHTFMQLKNRLARWLFKRLSHNYTGASMLDPYTIMHSTIVRDSALVNTTRIRDQVRYLCDALDELKASHEGEHGKRRVLLAYEKQITTGPRNKIEDVKYILTPDPNFVGQMKKANTRHHEIERRAVEMGVLTDEDLVERHVKEVRRTQPTYPTITRGSRHRGP